ncbi:MAG: hypothetical protein JXB49_11580 [Bacteroidales bacterium]|nr:hypothetical protein [Bacteroidales bacterium]
MRKFRVFALIAVCSAVLMSCSTSTRSMKEAASYIEFTASDFEYSDQVTGEATQVKIVGIDFARLFSKKYGEINAPAGTLSLPIIGNYMNGMVNLYALYNIYQDNPGYDVILYPTYESKKTGIPVIFVTTKVKVTARLGKLKK